MEPIRKRKQRATASVDAIERGYRLRADIDDKLAFAVRLGDAKKVKELLKQGADVNAQEPDGTTPQSVACRKCFVSLVRPLLGNGADVNTRSDSGRTPLIYSFAFESKKALRVVNLLLDHGADPHETDDDGLTPLMHAARDVDVSSHEVLLSADVDVFD